MFTQKLSANWGEREIFNFIKHTLWIRTCTYTHAHAHVPTHVIYVWPPSELPKTIISTFCHMIPNFLKGVVEIKQNRLNIAQNRTKEVYILTMIDNNVKSDKRMFNPDHWKDLLDPNHWKDLLEPDHWKDPNQHNANSSLAKTFDDWIT